MAGGKKVKAFFPKNRRNPFLFAKKSLCGAVFRVLDESGRPDTMKPSALSRFVFGLRGSLFARETFINLYCFMTGFLRLLHLMYTRNIRGKSDGKFFQLNFAQNIDKRVYYIV